MRKLTLTLAAGAAALALGGVAHAQAPRAAQPLTRAAAEQRSDKAFDRLDANHDGSLSYAEFAANRADRDGARKDRSARHGEHLGRPGSHRMAARGFAGRGIVRLADADKDGTITKAEFHAAALTRFDRLDADKDGTVTREEAKAARDSMRQRWQVRREAQRAS